ncbi:MAG: PhnD/SsuA/transferrin family substrate-binding protein, partial [Gammaproteobacteria bacterium]|nr:PhnD/SsuA/transferrin family substrate-binding protein [Gammaproteobacteria bacterium]
EDSPAASLADLRGYRCAFSRRDSHSGYNVLRASIAPLARGGAFFSETLESGAHARSIALVASRRADVCAVDCVTHALMARHGPAALEGTRVLCATARAPGLPYVTRAGIGVDRLERLRDGVRAAFADPALAATREALLLAGVEFLPLAAY